MSKLKIAIALGALAIPAMAFAHPPIGNAYATRGECEAKLADENITHALDKVEAGIYENVGEAMKEMHDHFWCEQDPDDGNWYMLRTPF